ncbi:LuxR family transcriptional regulator [Formosa undariae]|uniref:LuxR family transcriptional regulator n=1 Tax=Formosa undariae TaxID=1325436 RepID=A0ABV5F6I4_9FLAO
MTTQRIYPGLACSNLEFFNHNNQVKAFNNGAMIDFHDLPYGYHQVLKDALVAEPEANDILKEWHPDSEMKRHENFVKCRFGGLDFTPDIKDMELQEGEYWDCPLRGSCKGEGKVCKSISYKGNPLTNMDIKLLKLLHTSLTNDNLAEEMNMPLGSFHVFKRKLYQKLDIQTKPEAVIAAVLLNLI